MSMSEELVAPRRLEKWWMLSVLPEEKLDNVLTMSRQGERRISERCALG